MQVFKSVAVCEQDSIYNTVKLCELSATSSWLEEVRVKTIFNWSK